MKNFKYTLGFAAIVLFAVLVNAQTAQAGKLDNITFPVEELGGCGSKDECKTYCDDTANLDKCLAFAEKQNLMTGDELNQAKNYAKLMKTNATFPGGAKNPAKAREYCSSPDHMEECMAFAEKNSLISKTEAQEARKFIPLMKSGQTPGGCKSKDECESYCKDEGKFDECLAFGRKHGLVRDEEASKFKEFREKGGPGGCKSKDECASFCNSPDNQTTCLEFAEKSGFVKKEELQNIREGVGMMRARLADNPQVEQCVSGHIDKKMFEKMSNGELMPSPEVAEGMQECFKKFEEVMREDAKKKFGGEGKPEIRDCIKQEVGQESLTMIEGGQPPADIEKSDKIRHCYEKFNPKEDRRDREHMEMENRGDDDSMPPVGGAGQGMPEEVKACVLAKIGQDNLQDADKDKLNSAARACSEAAKTARPKSLDGEAERLKQQYQERTEKLKKEQELKKREYEQNREQLKESQEQQREQYKQRYDDDALERKYSPTPTGTYPKPVEGSTYPVR